MSQSAFDEPLNFGGSKLTEGQKIEVELTDLVLQKKVVSYNSALKGHKGLIGKEYDTLDAEQQAMVNNAAVEYWPQRDNETEPRAKPRFSNRITFQFRHPETDIKFLYDAQFDMSEDGFPSKKLRDFVKRSTGVEVQGNEGFKWGDLYKKGDKFVSLVTKDNNFWKLDINSVMKSELAGPVPTSNNTSTLSENASKLFDYIKGNLVGQPVRTVVDLFNNFSAVGMGSYADVQKAWTEIRLSGVKYTADGKTFGFDN